MSDVLHGTPRPVSLHESVSETFTADLPAVDGASSTVESERSVAAPVSLTFRENVGFERVHRIVETTVAGAMLLAASPVLAVAAVSILLDDGWPVIFRQRRVGRFGKLFTIFKLRTMRKSNCIDGLSPTSGRDPRITRVGYWLRKSSIDELPQLLNIVRGEMVFVGPRPEMPFLVRAYEPWQHLRHLVKPGITGFWQTTCRSTVPLHLPEATLLDLEHVRNRSYPTRLLILVRTVRILLTAIGAY